MTAQSSTPAAKKVIGRPFKPGQSGNPSGKPKLAGLIDQYCGAGGVKLIEALAAIALGNAGQRLAVFGESVRVGAKDRVSALRELSDRRFGKAPQVMEDGDGNSLLPTVIVNNYHGIAAPKGKA